MSLFTRRNANGEHSGLIERLDSWREREGQLDEDVRRAQQGDHDAFDRLAERHVTTLYRLAAAIVGTSDAADVVWAGDRVIRWSGTAGESVVAPRGGLELVLSR
jgi:hypothetical protein